MIDLIIKNGRLYDPSQNLDTCGDIAVNHGKIIEIGHSLNYESFNTINAKGYFVLPGLIDAHTHINWLGNYISMPADLATIPYGVTAAIDAGSSGVSNYESLLRYLETCEVKSKIMLHASAGGQMMSRQFAENIDPSVWNQDLFERAFEKYGDKIIGIKLRMSRNVVKELGIKPLEAALNLAEHFHTRVIIHPTDPCVPMGQLADMLRPGDVMAHMYHGDGWTIMDNGKVNEHILNAQRRGVIFDVSQGWGNFNITIAKQAIAQGFIPYTISTDLNKENWNRYYDFSLLMVMSKFIALGMPFSEIVRSVTANAAAIFGDPDNLGTLKKGTDADISVIELADQKIEFKDKYNNMLPGTQILKAKATIVNGNLLYCSSDTLSVR